MSAEISPHMVQVKEPQNENVGVEITLFSSEKVKELIEPETITETGVGNSSTINARRRIQRARFNPGWRRR